MAAVVLNISNYAKCLCPVCPVETGSACIGAKQEKWVETRKAVGKVLERYHDHPEAYEMEMGALENSGIGRELGFQEPKSVDMKELFCSGTVGGSDCGDLNKKQICQCPTCAVWEAHGLDGTYYCLK